tara:strand:- start:868 stop:1326 length:459 start_codon:yes stop_codon:yes gene_type:complete
MNMDINRIFNLFNPDDDFRSPTKKESGVDFQFEEFKTTPPYYIGMFEKMILNHNNVRNQVVKLFQKSNEEFNLHEIEEAGEFMAYNRAWEYIKDCELDDQCWKESLLLRNSDYLITALKLATHYFEGYEEYEKCAFLNKIKLFLEDNLAPES